MGSRFRCVVYMFVPVLLMLASGCDSSDAGDDLHGAVLATEPATAKDCGEGPHPGMRPNGMPEVTMHWLAGTQPVGGSATLYLCQVQPLVGTINFVSSPGVQVSPTSLSFNATAEAILKIVVTVDSSAKSGADITLGATLPDFTGALNGPTIHISDGRWSFDLPGGADSEVVPLGGRNRVILLGVVVCIVGAACFVTGVARNSGRGVATAAVVFLLGFALVLVGFHTRAPLPPLCDREPQSRECGF